MVFQAHVCDICGHKITASDLIRIDREVMAKIDEIAAAQVRANAYLSNEAIRQL
jgi:predicted transcriptional regulator